MTSIATHAGPVLPERARKVDRISNRGRCSPKGAVGPAWVPLHGEHTLASSEGSLYSAHVRDQSDYPAERRYEQAWKEHLILEHLSVYAQGGKVWRITSPMVRIKQDTTVRMIR